RPVESRLAPAAADPLALCLAFRSIGFDTVYAADLDAIRGWGSHGALIGRIRRETGLRVMLDAGVRRLPDLDGLLATGVEAAVVGSETLEALADLPGMVRRAGPERLLFSLDLKAGAVLSPDLTTAARAPIAVLAEAAAAGVRQAILLDLSTVGAGAGPNLPLLRTACSALPGMSILAGGGIRGPADLADIHEAGAAGCLIATCLHTGALSAEAVKPWIRV
ncbi:MAG TPA: HisA/HisF-related TIM barrel protein, partial [Symbiobacteriaceae bacterium]|nr:HisA/HisF-related TIM barrel protein [Symbiobacteriaceae bacterium]